MNTFDQDVEACLKTLRAGGLILYPTDTIWGIGCDASNAEAVAKVYALKKRPDAKSLIVLMADEREVLRYVAAADLAVFDFLKTTEKPTTVIYEGGIGFAENLLPADGSVAIRICSDEFCRQLILRFRKPIVSTSANISGEASPAHFGEVSEAIRAGVDYVVTYRQQERTPAQASSILRWVKGKPEWIRR